MLLNFLLLLSTHVTQQQQLGHTRSTHSHSYNLQAQYT